MLKMGNIRQSKSPAGVDTLLVVEPHVCGLLLWIDYQGLNHMTILNLYVLPLMIDLCARMQGAILFTTINLRSGCIRLRIKEGDQWKTAPRTCYTHFEYPVMPFGLTNAPASFTNMKEEIFRDLIDHGVVVYIDDIFISYATSDRHVAPIREVLCLLGEWNLAAALERSVSLHISSPMKLWG